MTTDLPAAFTGHPYLSMHALLPLAAVLPVRDENGQPKEIVYGGQPRNLITSQAERRADRTWARRRANAGEGHLAGHSMGIRTREWGRMTRDLLADTYGWDRGEAMEWARAVLRSIGLVFGDRETTVDLTQVLVFAPQDAADKLAAAINTHHQDNDMATWFADYQKAKEAKEAEKKTKNRKKKDNDEKDSNTKEEKVKIPQLPKEMRARVITALAPRDAVDIALYGRFLAGIADAADVDGAVQTAHTFTVHAAEHVDDFYAAADDEKLNRKDNATALDHLDAADNAGAGMTGYQALISGLFYRHAVLDRRKLRANLAAAGMPPQEAEEAAQRAERELVDAFVNSMPEAKKNSTASTGALPAITLVHDGKRPFSYAGAFCRPIDEAADGPATIAAAHRLLRHHQLITSKRDDITTGRALTYDLDIDDMLTKMAADGHTIPAPANTVEELTAK